VITFSDSKEIDPSCLVPLFDQADWSRGRTVEQTRTMLLHTDLAISAWDQSRLIGFSRVLTDYVFRASIWDVIVDRDYQGKDIGTQLMKRILSHPSLDRVELFWLCTRNRQAFYTTLGFSDKEQTGMVWSRKRR
jgi:ribosomal protein S18 acetylase RimI-like enzyme